MAPYMLTWKTDGRLHWKDDFPFSARFADSVLTLVRKVGVQRSVKGVASPVSPK